MVWPFVRIVSMRRFERMSHNRVLGKNKKIVLRKVSICMLWYGISVDEGNVTLHHTCHTDQLSVFEPDASFLMAESQLLAFLDYGETLGNIVSSAADMTSSGSSFKVSHPQRSKISPVRPVLTFYLIETHFDKSIEYIMKHGFQHF